MHTQTVGTNSDAVFRTHPTNYARARLQINIVIQTIVITYALWMQAGTVSTAINITFVDISTVHFSIVCALTLWIRAYTTREYRRWLTFLLTFQSQRKTQTCGIGRTFKASL